jgi:hypothetical protein
MGVAIRISEKFTFCVTLLPEMGNFDYKAFISYSHLDKPWAENCRNPLKPAATRTCSWIPNGSKPGGNGIRRF